MSTTYALPGSAASPIRPLPRSFHSQTNSVPPTTFDPPPWTSQNRSGSRSPARSPSHNRQFDSNPQFNLAQAHSHASSLSSYLPSKLSFATNSADAMPRGRPRGESDLGRPKLATRNSATGTGLAQIIINDEETYIPPPQPLSSSKVIAQLITSILIPLPFLLSSLNNHLTIIDHSGHGLKTEAEEVLGEVAASAATIPDSLVNLVKVSALTSGTLLLVGAYGMWSRSAPTKRSRKNSLSTVKEPTASFSSYFSTLRRILLRIASVALPFVATMEIGGARVGLLLLMAVAGGALDTQETRSTDGKFKRSMRTVTNHKWAFTVFALSFCYDMILHVEGSEYASTFRGHIALAKSVLLLSPPMPGMTSTTAIPLSPKPPSTPSTPTRATWQDHTSSSRQNSQVVSKSDLIRTSDDVRSSLAAGVILAVITLLLSTSLSPLKYLTITTLLIFLGSILASTGLFVFSNPASIRSRGNVGLIAGICLCTAFGLVIHYSSSIATLGLMILSCLVYVAVHFDTQSVHSHRKVVTHQHSHQPKQHSHSKPNASRITQFLLRHTESFPLMHGILLDKESRRIAYFMCINLGFMFVQTFYAVVSGSLGLLSDSIHMFFDCVGLFAGLVAAVMSKWPPNSRYPYGYGKVETLSGLGNGIFLMIISVEIIWESFERFMEGAELKRLTELLLVSAGGLLVNLIGLKFIGHAHHGHGHDHGHSHDHGNDNMAGIYLHILADTMGSVAVIISTLLTVYTGWSGWDPLASCIIAILIILASYPLVVGSARGLLLTVPSEVEYALRSSLQELSGLRGVAGYAVPRFWLDDGEHVGHDHHDHDHDHDHDHSHKKENDHKHEVKHDHDHSHTHKHSHSHNHDHEHTHSEITNLDQVHAESHDRNHVHAKSNSHSHAHVHDVSKPQSHNECNNHDHGKQRMLGVIHILAAKGSDTQDVLRRTDDFFKERNMHVVVHVEAEGQSRCWCGSERNSRNS